MRTVLLPSSDCIASFRLSRDRALSLEELVTFEPDHRAEADKNAKENIGDTKDGKSEKCPQPRNGKRQDHDAHGNGYNQWNELVGVLKCIDDRKVK